tara:strand:- start:2138 stop:2266 length:129 start_codon:yes stop_codon:yes gene_type:complete
MKENLILVKKDGNKRLSLVNVEAWSEEVHLIDIVNLKNILTQ